MIKSIPKPIIVIALIYWAVSILLFNEYGVKNVSDSHRYLDYANNLKHGFYFDERNFWYFGYVMFIYVIQLIHQSELAIVIAQHIWSFVAVISLYYTYRLLFKQEKGAILAPLGYIFFIEILSWNSYLLCESIYISNTCISFYLLALIYRKRPHIWIYIFAALFILFTAITKPTGIALIGALIFISFYRIWEKIKKRTVRFALVFCSLVLFLLLLNKMLSAYLVIENYQNGEIVFGINSLPDKPVYESLRINPPENLFIPPKNDPPLLRIPSFVIHNPVFWLKLFFNKVFYFLINIRPYWSLKHIIFNLLFLLPVYFYSIRGIVYHRYSKDITLFFVVYFSIHVLGIGITFLDWDPRFIMPLLPVLFLLASAEIIRDYEKIISLINKKSNLLKSFRKP